MQSIQDGRIFSAIKDRFVAIPHVFATSSLSGEYLMEQAGIKADLSNTNIRPLVKYRLNTGYLEYEKTEVKFIQEYLPPELDVIDLGAGIGFTACVADRKLNQGRDVIAIEANPKLESSIKYNAGLNGSSVKVISAGYSPSVGTIEISDKDSYRSNSVYENTSDEVEVETTSLVEITNEFSIDSFSLISDIEGSEAELIQEIELIKSKCHTIIIEIHEEKNSAVKETISRLENEGFRLIDSEERVRVFQNQAL